MKKMKLVHSDTSGYDSSAIEIDFTTSASNSSFQTPIEKRVIKIEPEV
jgi:hypothetical protein